MSSQRYLTDWTFSRALAHARHGSKHSEFDGIERIRLVKESGDDSISIFRINRNGSLTDLGKVHGLAASSVGIAGR